MNLSKNLERKLQEYSISQFPREACGFILNNNEFITLENIHPEPLSNFLTCPFEYLKYKDQIKYIFHSHTREDSNKPLESYLTPSKSDMQNQMLFNVPWVLLACDVNRSTHCEIFGWQIIRDDFIGKTFVHGIRDCYSLVRNYFYKTKGCLLKEIPRENFWWESDENLYMKSFKSVGFSEVFRENNKFEVNDLLLFKIGRTKSINHAGVYIGNGWMLHHLYHGLSSKVPVSQYLKFLEKVIIYDDESQSTRDVFTSPSNVIVI